MTHTDCLHKKWDVRQKDSLLEDKISRELNIFPVTAGLLLSRGIRGIKEAESFLNPSLSSLHDPFLIPDMEKGVSRIRKALDRGEKILVYGDRDVDGTTATVIMTDILRKIGGDVVYFVPSAEGYGLHREIIDTYKEEGVSLIITVDCGVRDVEQILRAKELGMDTVVTDHHEVPLSLPPAVALIDPKSRDSKYPFFDIAGCTVAFKTCQALYETMFPDRSRNEKLFLIQQYLDLLTLGSVADVVPLVDENRILVKEGLPLLPKTSRLGLSLLLERCGISSSPTATEIAWNVTPVLNAGSRMGKSELSCRLMLSRSREECERLLDEIEKLNGERKSKQTKSYRIINSALAEQNEDSDRIIVVASPDAEVEVAGIIASRVVDQYNRPAVVLVMKGDGITGSARSIESFDIVSALDGCRDLLLKYGGHKAAAGLSLEGAKLEEFRARIKGIAKSGIAEEDLVPKIGIDAKLEFAEVTDGLARDIEKLSPFGTGNPVPVFALYGAVLVRYASIGADSAHLRVKLSNGKSGSCLEGIGWNLGKAGDELIEGGKVDLAFRMEFNAWEGRDYLRLLIEDIRPSG